jgi:hypothetical protein
LGPGPVIPLHDLVRKHPSAIDAGFALFQAAEPCTARAFGSLRPSRCDPPGEPLIALVVVLVSTRPARRLKAVTPACVPAELGHGSCLSAAPAALH